MKLTTESRDNENEGREGWVMTCSKTATSGLDKWSHCGSALNLHSFYWPVDSPVLQKEVNLYEIQCKNASTVAANASAASTSHLTYELS